MKQNQYFAFKNLFFSKTTLDVGQKSQKIFNNPLLEKKYYENFTKVFQSAIHSTHTYHFDEEKHLSLSDTHVQTRTNTHACTRIKSITDS